MNYIFPEYTYESETGKEIFRGLCFSDTTTKALVLDDGTVVWGEEDAVDSRAPVWGIYECCTNDKTILSITAVVVPLTSDGSVTRCLKFGHTEAEIHLNEREENHKGLHYTWDSIKGRGHNLWFNKEIKYLKPVRLHIQYKDGHTETLLEKDFMLDEYYLYDYVPSMDGLERLYGDDFDPVNMCEKLLSEKRASEYYVPEDEELFKKRWGEMLEAFEESKRKREEEQKRFEARLAAEEAAEAAAAAERATFKWKWNDFWHRFKKWAGFR